MSASFVLQYGGAGVRFHGKAVRLVPDHLAEKFPAESDAWLAAHQAGLAPHLCRVRPSSELWDQTQTPTQT